MRTSVAVAVLLGVVLLGGCRGCDEGPQQVPPSARVVPTSVAFGKAKAGASVARALTVHADTRADVQVTGARLEDLGEPGASAAFAVSGVPLTVAALGQAALEVTFSPAGVRGYDARLFLETNDPEHPSVEVVLVGEGAAPSLALTPVCEQAARCRGTVTVSPPTIDFGAEVFGRQQPLPSGELPSVVLQNTGEVELLVSGLALEGPDAAAFSLAAHVLVDSGPGGQPALVLAPGEAASVPLRFAPTSEAQGAYAAQLVVRSDAQETPEVRVALSGALQPNAPPDVCANLTRVRRGAETLDQRGTEADWAPLRTPPPGGVYDFTTSRNVQPALVDANRNVTPTRVTLSALSPGGDAACTRDPEEGRQRLVFTWEVVTAPPGATAARILPVAGVSPAGAEVEVELGPQAGLYEVRLQVADPQGGPSVSRTLRFAAVPREDLVVQLSWDGPGGVFQNVDLDLHLVRPSTAQRLSPAPLAGAFAWFAQEDQPESGVQTSGDLNGRALTEARAHPTTYGFDWGEPELEADNPVLPYDDTGASLQLETVSLDAPENDALCRTGACTYKVLVHYYRDGRAPTGAPACTVTGATGCRDGERCTCAEGFACVATTAPATGAALGEGKCFRAPRPVVRVFAKAAPAPLAVIPVGAEVLQLGAPCQLLHVANVRWPARLLPDGGTPPPGGTGEPQVEVVGLQADGGLQPVVRRFGQRTNGGLTCLGNDPPAGGAGAWYQDANDPP